VFCPNCGASNPDIATVCGQCKQPIPQFSSTAPVPPAPQAPPPGVPGEMGIPGAPARIADVPNYLVHSILLAVFSLLCCVSTCGFGIPALALAVVAIVFSTQVNSKLGANDVAGAQAASKNAKLFSWISFGLLMGAFVIYIILFFLGMVSNYWQRHY
jgi:hypothetical protein